MDAGKDKLDTWISNMVSNARNPDKAPKQAKAQEIQSSTVNNAEQLKIESSNNPENQTQTTNNSSSQKLEWWHPSNQTSEISGELKVTTAASKTHPDLVGVSSPKKETKLNEAAPSRTPIQTDWKEEYRNKDLKYIDDQLADLWINGGVRDYVVQQLKAGKSDDEIWKPIEHLRDHMYSPSFDYEALQTAKPELVNLLKLSALLIDRAEYTSFENLHKNYTIKTLGVSEAQGLEELVNQTANQSFTPKPLEIDFKQDKTSKRLRELWINKGVYNVFKLLSVIIPPDKIYGGIPLLLDITSNNQLIETLGSKMSDIDEFMELCNLSESIVQEEILNGSMEKKLDKILKNAGLGSVSHPIAPNFIPRESNKT